MLDCAYNGNEIANDEGTVQGKVASRIGSAGAAMADTQIGAEIGAPDDGALMARVVVADQGAFALLVDRHVGPASAFVQRMTGLGLESEDVVQEAFLKVWRNAASWDPGRGSFKTWFYRVLYNAAVDRMRRSVATTDHDLSEVADGADGPEDVARQRQVHRRVRAALMTLPERQRAAVVLSYYEGLSNRDAAAALEVSVKALESLLVRARRTLAAALAPLHTAEGG